MCQPPTGAADWLEGTTLAYIVDFLDAAGAPEFRIYYQDAPTDGPVGHVPEDILAQRSIDLAILCTGTYDRVADHPGELLAHLQPRFVLAGHWEDFFRPQDEPLRPIPFLDLDEFEQRLTDAMPQGSGAPRWARPEPGMTYTLEAR